MWDVSSYICILSKDNIHLMYIKVKQNRQWHVHRNSQLKISYIYIYQKMGQYKKNGCYSSTIDQKKWYMWCWHTNWYIARDQNQRSSIEHLTLSCTLTSRRSRGSKWRRRRWHIWSGRRSCTPRLSHILRKVLHSECLIWHRAGICSIVIHCPSWMKLDLILYQLQSFLCSLGVLSPKICVPLSLH